MNNECFTFASEYYINIFDTVTIIFFQICTNIYSKRRIHTFPKVIFWLSEFNERNCNLISALCFPSPSHQSITLPTYSFSGFHLFKDSGIHSFTLSRFLLHHSCQEIQVSFVSRRLITGTHFQFTSAFLFLALFLPTWKSYLKRRHIPPTLPSSQNIATPMSLHSMSSFFLSVLDSIYRTGCQISSIKTDPRFVCFIATVLYQPWLSLIPPTAPGKTRESTPTPSFFISSKTSVMADKNDTSYNLVFGKEDWKSCRFCLSWYVFFWNVI